MQQIESTPPVHSQKNQPPETNRQKSVSDLMTIFTRKFGDNLKRVMRDNDDRWDYEKIKFWQSLCTLSSQKAGHLLDQDDPPNIDEAAFLTEEEYETLLAGMNLL